MLEAPVCTGPAAKAVIRELTLAQVREWDCGAKPNPAFPKQQAVPGTRVPTLDEVFALAPKGKFLFNIETKIFPQKPELTPPPEEFARMVLAAVRKHHLEARVVLQSFDFRTLIAMKALAPEIKLSALYEGAAEGFRGDRQGGGCGNRFAGCPAGDAGAGEGGARGGDGSAAVDGRTRLRNGNAWQMRAWTGSSPTIQRLSSRG